MSALGHEDGRPAVWVVKGDALERRPVEVAAYAGEQVVVSAGLEDREQVVTAGVQKLDPGVRVRPWTEPLR
jgi:multidrug efflux pump subunit AcrA (membrane-fusion protein)